MKKILLSAAAFAVVAVSTAVVAPTTSEAIPAFARQTGAACLACHFQSFPTLNSFGRSFKVGALTDVGEQALIEDDDLSIPSSLNITLVFRPQFAQTTSAAGVTTRSITPPADQVILIGGRVGSNTGTFVEVGFGGPAQQGGFANSQMFNSWDFGAVKGGLNFFNTSFGEDAGLQLMSVWGQHGGLLRGKGVSINNRMGAAGNTVGVAAWVANETFAIQVGGTDQSATVGTSFKLAPMVRANYFMEVGDFEVAVGGILISGQNGGPAPTVKTDAKRWGIDAQAQGTIADMKLGIYADYASAKKSSVAKANVYNASLFNNRTGYSLRATLKPLHRVVAIVGYGVDKTGGVSTKSTLVGAEYEVYQNFVIALTHESVKVSGLTAAAILAGGGLNGTTKTTTLDFEALM